MAKRTNSQIQSKNLLASRVVEHHFGHPPQTIEYMAGGKTNFVFEARIDSGDYIVRIATVQHKLQDFIKEQWATQRALEAGVPVPEILEVGNEVIPLPYMLQRRTEGQVATEHPKRREILTQLGRYARIIHGIETTGFGEVFDWSLNKLTKKRTWVEYLDEELQAPARLEFFERHAILPRKKLAHLRALTEKIRRWKRPPALNHCDLRLKNVIVDPSSGAIRAIIDWENCSSNIAPYWDLSIALHDLSIDGKQYFLEGYNLDLAAFSRDAYALTVFNLLNYVPYLQTIVDQKNEREWELNRLRLNGCLDLFAL